MIQVGDVVLIFDGTIRPPKHKRLICVCAAEGFFLRINSNPHFRPHLLISATDNGGCIQYDSYVELRGILEYDLEYLEQSFSAGEARILGRIGITTIHRLKQAVLEAVTLTPQEKQIISRNLAQLLE